MRSAGLHVILSGAPQARSRRIPARAARPQLGSSGARQPRAPPQVQAARSPLCSSSRRFPVFSDPSVARVDAVLAKTGLMGVESTVLAPNMRRLEAHKLAEGPRIVDSTMLRPLMWLESTVESRLDAVKATPRRHALAHPAARSRP